MPTEHWDWMYPTLDQICKLLTQPLPEPEEVDKPGFDDDDD